MVNNAKQSEDTAIIYISFMNVIFCGKNFPFFEKDNMTKTGVRFLTLISAKSLKIQFMQGKELSHIDGLFLSVRPLHFSKCWKSGNIIQL